MAKYEILFSKEREARGLKPWGLFEIVDDNFSRGISQHATKEEVMTAMLELMAKDGK